MNTIIIPDASDRGTDGERTVLLLCYVLHALAIAGLTTVIAVIIDHVKARETQSAFIRSHHVWLLRTFWWGLLWLVISSILVYVLVGFLGFALIGIWWLYRIIRGALAFAESRPMPV